MWSRLKSISLIILFILSLLFVSSCFLSVSAATVQDNEQQSVTLSYNEYNQLRNNLSTLAQNSQMQKERIVQLEMLLKTASSSTTESAEALIEARKQLTEAKMQINEQATQLQTLNSLLEMQQQQITKANVSLEIANQSLKQLEQEIKDKQAQERKNKVLLMLATASAIYFAMK